ncbi:class I SAM-dependent DNA methyltransferase [Sphingomonas sp. TX0522]|uniref:class I SAM-dependent DNA methyltransferase n=1 Tax=Sphingomonas sp. TX0522 TaxID=2479205 RepID=UPI0018DF5FBC|nr:class I SAM-dependent DNA methyltransferase [Sphingomonas sp. TX0522]MBI0533063.1 class I SAM-dependent DNA methyltransferase [Sphingomonas sp. TX0522]
MNTIQIEESLELLVQDVASGACPLHELPFRLMEAYDASRNEVNKLGMKQPAGLVSTDVLWPKKMLYRPAVAGDVQATVDALRSSLIGKKGAAAKNAPRFIVSTDGDEFLAIDTKTGESPSFDRLADLPVNYDYLMPMFGVERYKPAAETTADVRAARHMAKFHDAILDANPGFGLERIHDLNLFMTRILFCMFAQNTGIFDKDLFVDTLRREAMQIDGSDTQRVIEDVFLALDIPKEGNRTGAGVRSRRIASDFPYVNGGLFRDRTAVPAFNRRARRLLLEAADLHWDQIHADIFGSMIQAVVHTDMRADFGMHYTSVPNIMKVLDPLFLNSLRQQLTAAGDNVKALERLNARIASIRVFDPACGSGNFLIIAYRELRQIETEAFRRIRNVRRKGQLPLAEFETGIKISSFHGIDPVDFACETAKLSLWISQYQMNKKLDEICSSPAPALPLTDAGSIVPGNALRKSWTEVCPPIEGTEIYVVGNPPYLGRANQTPEQKQDIIKVFSPLTKKFKKLDYVACWFVLASRYLTAGGAGFAFVATNSICQGEQVGLLWPHVLDGTKEIRFAFQSFKWTNSAARNAAVICIIAGIAAKSSNPKMLISSESIRETPNINAYLAAAPNLIVNAIPNRQSKKPLMRFGNMPADGGALLMTQEERDDLVERNPQAARFIREFYGSKELIASSPRYCLWIEDGDLEEATFIRPIADRIAASAAFRQHEDRDKGISALAAYPHRFREMHQPRASQLVVPSASSERRPFIPIAFLGADAVVSNLAFSIHDPETWLFAIITSRLHAIWTGAVGGRLKTDYRYSNTLVYNTFPIPDLSAEQKTDLEDHALSILRAREPHLADGRSLAWLYNPETMPADLRQAHRDLDQQIEGIYVGRPFVDDTERLSHLFKLYARTHKPKNS